MWDGQPQIYQPIPQLLRVLQTFRYHLAAQVAVVSPEAEAEEAAEPSNLVNKSNRVSYDSYEVNKRRKDIVF